MVSLDPWIKSPPFFMPSGHFTRCMGIRLMIFKNFPQFVVICTVKGYQTTRLLKNLYAGQEATVSTGHGTTDWFQIRKGVQQGCTLSLRSFNLYAEYIMRNAELDEAQTGIKVTRRNINNLRYEDDASLMAESKEELKSLLMKVKEWWKWKRSVKNLA